MRGLYLPILGLSILLLFFIQSATTLVEAVYILELLNTSLDEKALGVLFFFTPLLLLPFKERIPRWLVWLAYVLIFFGRGLIPYLPTVPRMLASGAGSGAALILLPVMLTAFHRPGEKPGYEYGSPALALAVAGSILLRSVYSTLDISLTPDFAWIGWVLGVFLGLVILVIPWQLASQSTAKVEGVTGASIGVMGILGLVYIVFSSPGVIARWTESDYRLVVIAVAMLTFLWLMAPVYWPDWQARITTPVLFAWNVMFTLALTATILVHTFPFPPTPESPAVVVGTPTIGQQIPLVLMLLLFPVIYADFALFSRVLCSGTITPRQLAPGFLWGVAILVAVIFMNIFSNVWGYVEPVSPFFRNRFWVSLLTLAGMVSLASLLVRRKYTLPVDNESAQLHRTPRLWWLGAILLLGTIAGVWLDEQRNEAQPGTGPLVVMTANIQQANDRWGEKAYLRQLALIQRVNPDILALQESDSARISLGNNDYVRFYANRLGYTSYYGPKTVTGTYGTAILSRFPLENTRAIFSYSDQDEIGTAAAEIQVGDRRLAIFNVHPDGSDTARQVFARELLSQAAGLENVILLGDFNLRWSDEPLQWIDAEYKHAWREADDSPAAGLPPELQEAELIDHVFVSPQLTVRQPVYLPPPESVTDHPVFWVMLNWSP
jgi:endonuclease/exonuclease/phosphatase family metal-dependent hydrolase